VGIGAPKLPHRFPPQVHYLDSNPGIPIPVCWEWYELDPEKIHSSRFIGIEELVFTEPCPEHQEPIIEVGLMRCETAFSMDTSSIKYGQGVTREVGHDMSQWEVRRVMVVTDPNLATMEPVSLVLEALRDAGIEGVLFDQVHVEPTDESIQTAIEFATEGRFDGYVAVGGGSSIDTAKAANLYACWPADLLAYVNSPVGQGRPVPGRLKPLIAVPTTAGTGSETTGVAIFDYTPLHAKTGIAHRALRPVLGLIDPDNTRNLPPQAEARGQMLLAATFAGIGFGNAGVHLPHGMSYPVSGMVRDFVPDGYHSRRPLIPHGMSVILNAPAVFRFTAPAAPERHLEVARLMGSDVSDAGPEDAGEVLAQAIINLMRQTGMPNGLKAVGYGPGDVDALVAGTIVQHRVTKLSPRPADEAELKDLFLNSMTLW
jgi:hydroxyacid-oxoacid transhydrogenase